MCRTATDVSLASSLRNNPHFHTVSAWEIPEMLKNVSTLCLCSFQNVVVCKSTLYSLFYSSIVFTHTATDVLVRMSRRQ